jgi:hypothetical protein
MFARKTVRAAAVFLIVGATFMAHAHQVRAAELQGAGNSAAASKQIPVLSPHTFLTLVPVTLQR